ncbi:MAG: TolC family protein [Planctomycetota bacterium]|jgi:cobalt-zinc-cadmium efflux system outer membrane protein|nr:TolC family protein [Planctomycetota bacterium]
MRFTVTVTAILAVFFSACTPVWEVSARRIQSENSQRALVTEGTARMQGPPTSSALVNDDHQQDRAPTDLDGLVLFGLDRNPAVQAKSIAVDRMTHRVDATGSLPAPKIQVAPFGDMAQTAAGEVALMAGVSQQFPAPGLLSAQVARARADVRTAEAAWHAEQVKIAAEIRKAWWSWRAATRSHSIVDEQISLLSQLQQQVLQRLEVGGGKQSDVLRIGVEIDRLRTMQMAWNERAQTSMANLRQALSLPQEEPLPDIHNKLPSQNRYREDQLLPLARQYRADVLGNLANRQRADALRNMAVARHRPEFGLSFNYNMVDDRNLMGPTSGQDQWWVGASMSLPIWFDSYGASDREAEAARDEVASERLAISDTLKRDVRTALSGWESAHEQLALFRGGMIEQAKQAYQAETSNYMAGTSSFADIIQSAQQLLMLEMSIVRLTRDAGVAEARILQSAGVISSAIQQLRELE